MKRSFYKTIILVIILMALISISGSFYAQAQDEVGPIDEPFKPTGKIAPPHNPMGLVNPAIAPDPGKWYINAGVVFMPSSSTSTWVNEISGCVSPTSTGIWRAGLNLPDGSIIKSFSIGYYNTVDSLSSAAILFRFSYTGEYFILAIVNTRSGAVITGYQSDWIDSPDVTVDNFNNSYVMIWSGSTSQQLCYGQVNYSPPSIFGTALPLTVKQP